MPPLLDFDRALVEAAPAFEHPWLTAVFVVLSAWWVKGPLLVGLGLCSDLWRRRLPLALRRRGRGRRGRVARRRRPQGGLRPRRVRRWPIPGSGSLVSIPDNPSFPSGHSATAFAAATAIAMLCPRLRPRGAGHRRRGRALARLPARALPARRAGGRAARRRPGRRCARSSRCGWPGSPGPLAPRLDLSTAARTAPAPAAARRGEARWGARIIVRYLSNYADNLQNVSRAVQPYIGRHLELVRRDSRAPARLSATGSWSPAGVAHLRYRLR